MLLRTSFVADPPCAAGRPGATRFNRHARVGDGRALRTGEHGHRTQAHTAFDDGRCPALVRDSLHGA